MPIRSASAPSDSASDRSPRRPRLLLITATHSYRAGAFLDAARRVEADVVIATERPQALAALHPAGHLTLDFRGLERAVEQVAEFAGTYPIDAVVAAEDEGALLAASAAARLGLAHAGVDAVAACRDKHRMRVAMAAAGLETPRFARFAIDDDPRRRAAEVGYPCVLKPLSLSASRGVLRADDPEEFVAAWARIVAILRRPEIGADSILVEDYLPGVEVALEGIVDRGRLRPLALFDKPDPLEGPTFEETIYVTPSRHDAALQSTIVRVTERATEALGLDHGPLHAELRIVRGVPWVIEIAPRSIGGLCSRALRFGGGTSLEEVVLRHALGLEWESLERESQASGVMMIPIPRAGVLRGIGGLEQAREVAGIEDVRITVPTGSELVPLPEGSRYLGFIFARADESAAVEAALRASHRCLELEIV